ncbi:MAG: T9SS type A sorting domain-containing protein [Bacteroidales bacterium]|nr:T9SS type A sorting domain-containing protein [Bacteroidales bacterium]
MFGLKKLFIFILLAAVHLVALAQFAPPAGQAGSTAMHSDSTAFVAWAESCVVERGRVNIAEPDAGFVSFGEATDAVGKADTAVVSLGDGGVATLSFANPIANGPGTDFAIFENGFLDDFLELAFVEVSSDGENYFRFSAVSLTPTEEQIETFGRLDATFIHNLAGKYRVGFGVPFDLEELKEEQGLDVNHIVSVRIVDVVGSIDDEFATFDEAGSKVNDPWPTPFPSGGFDLDAVGVIHNENNTDVPEYFKVSLLTVFPNPATDRIYIRSEIFLEKAWLTDVKGRLLKEVDGAGFHSSLDISSFPKGLLILHCLTEQGVVSVKIIKN